MRRLIIVAALALTLTAVAGVSRADAVSWPAHCRTSASFGKYLRCVDAHMNNLDSRLRAASRRLNALLNCEAIVPLTQYGDPAGTAGYEFNNGTDPTFFTTGLDVTATGDTVGSWFVIDTCETATTPRPLPRGVQLRPHPPAE